MGHMTQSAVHKSARKLYNTANLRSSGGISVVDQGAELLRLRQALARTTKELNDLKAATAQMVRYSV